MNNTIIEILNTPLFSIEERLRILEKIKNKELSRNDIDKILEVIHNFNEWFGIALNRYYRNMDTVYKKYLDKNLVIIKQWMIKISLEKDEIKSYEKGWDPDLILDQI